MSQIGKIDCGVLATIQAVADEKWDDPIQNSDYIANAEAARAVLENQRVRFEDITGRKDRAISLEWLEACAPTAVPCSDDCTITGDDISPLCKEYEVKCLREVTFKLPEREFRKRTFDFEEAMAQKMLVSKKALDEWLANYVVVGLAANSGVNKFTGGQGTVAGAQTTIPANLWDDTIWGYFAQVAALNKFTSPYLVSGVNLFQYAFNRRNEQMTEQGKAAAAKMGVLSGLYFDMQNVEAVAPTTSFLVHKTAVALVTKAYNPAGAANAINRAGVYHLWSEPSNNLPGVTYDVILQESCQSNELYHAVKVQVNGLFAVNPYPCDTDVTGMLKFKCG